MNRARPLTAGEIKLVQSVFRDGVDCARVRIVCGAWWLPEHRAAVSFGGKIYFPKKDCCCDFAQASVDLQHWFIHEITHVWQSQQGFPVLAAGICLWLRGGYYRRRAYDYGGHCMQGGFARMNLEQQADAVADYFADITLSGMSDLEGVLCDFLRRPHGKSVWPKFW